MKKFWKIWDASYGTQTKQYDTYAEAEVAAKKRAGMLKTDCDVVVFEAVATIIQPTPNFEVVKLS